ncbi:hypothetical protein ACMVYO_04575 [Staphylococcus hominis]|uniref:hypothetical protein n=1 Tax=Staphylococcus hominis TaxID=1290 RepID=UPI0039ED5596
MAEDPKFVVHGSQVQKWTDDIQQLKQERDAYKKQRDELIDDMQNVKRKAEILDKLEEMFETSANANRKHGFNGAAEVYERYLDIVRERGSDEEI